jgi:hypothetical protein
VCRSWCRGHQSKALEQKHGTLSSSPPDELTTFALAILNVDIAAGVFKAAILENTVDEHTFVKN